MPKYYCDYCDIFLTHDSASVRKAHNTGWKHRMHVEHYYNSELDQSKVQSVIDNITQAYIEAGLPGFPELIQVGSNGQRSSAPFGQSHPGRSGGPPGQHRPPQPYHNSSGGPPRPPMHHSGPPGMRPPVGMFPPGQMPMGGPQGGFPPRPPLIPPHSHPMMRPPPAFHTNGSGDGASNTTTAINGVGPNQAASAAPRMHPDRMRLAGGCM
ncbi:hypothetical protein BASA81_011429 [Batrachochytrium salamandrivorans]|nr:hypothetical protein BASA81_011429 [Batrachochytrium salamandrivorans]